MLTVVIPSYNHVKYIEECLNGAIGIRINKKILVVDDGSTDGTVELVKSIISNDKSNNIKLIQKVNSGLVSSLNMALAEVDTEFICFVASDDILVADGVAEVLTHLKGSPRLSFCVAGGVNFFPDGSLTPVYNFRHKIFLGLDKTRLNSDMYLNYPHPILLQSTLFRTKSLLDIGGWDQSIVLDDYPLFIKLFSYFEKEEYDFLEDVCFVKYRHHGLNSYSNSLRQYKMVVQVFDVMAPNDLKVKAKGFSLAYYMLILLREKKIRVLCTMVKMDSFGVFLWAIFRMPAIIFRTLWNRLS